MKKVKVREEKIIIWECPECPAWNRSKPIKVVTCHMCGSKFEAVIERTLNK